MKHLKFGFWAALILAGLLLGPAAVLADSFETLAKVEGQGPFSAPLFIGPQFACAFDMGQQVLFCVQAGTDGEPQTIPAKRRLAPDSVCPILAMLEDKVLVAGAAEQGGKLVLDIFDPANNTCQAWEGNLRIEGALLAAPKLLDGRWILQDAGQTIVLEPGQRVLFSAPGRGLPQRLDALLAPDVWRNSMQGSTLWIAGERTLQARSLADGKTIAEAKLDSPAQAAPIVLNDMVYVATERGLGLFNAGDGRRLAMLDRPMLPGSEPFLVKTEGRLYYSAVAGILCLNPESLRERSNYPVPGWYVLLHGDESWRFVQVYTKDTDGKRYASVYRQEIKSAQLQGGVEFTPPGSALRVLIDDRLVIEMAAGKLYSLEPIDLEPQAEKALSETPLRGLALSGETLAATTFSQLVLFGLIIQPLK